MTAYLLVESSSICLYCKFIIVVCDCWCRDGNGNVGDEPENFVIIVNDCFSILVLYLLQCLCSLYVHVLLL